MDTLIPNKKNYDHFSNSTVPTKKERMFPIRPIGTRTGKYVLLIKSPEM